MIKERQNKKKSDEYFITQPGFQTHYLEFETLNGNELLNLKKMNNKRKPKIRPKTANGIRPNNKLKINSNIKNEENKDEQKCNNLIFNKYIDIIHDLKLPENNKIQFKGFYSPMNCFNKLSGKYYSSSINVHVKNKRNKKNQIFSSYYEDY